MEQPEIKSDKLKENLETQISELDTLESMFYKPGEMKIDDPSALINIKKFISGESSEIPPYVDITLNINVDSLKLEVCVNLSHEYPDVEPDIYVRHHRLNREQHKKLNKNLSDYVSNFKGEQCIFTAVSWLQDNVTEYLEDQNETVAEIKVKSEKTVRYWIYSHHIYSKSKRREIMSLASTLKITGFCMAGKPGVICVEGNKDDCDDWWQTIKTMNWKRIFCKVTEDCRTSKFETFEEITFPNYGVKSNHMDMGELYKYLENHGCAYIFKDLFGVDNKNNL